MRTLSLRRPAPLLERGLYVTAGITLGTDHDGASVRSDRPLVVLALRPDGDGWLLTYRSLGAEPDQASSTLNSRMRPVAS